MKLKIYMKSGNAIVVNRVKDWSLKYNADQITSLHIEKTKTLFTRKHKGLVVGSLDLKQIEAIERL